MISPRKGPDIINGFLTSNPFIHPTVMWDRAALPGDLRYNDEFRCEEDYGFLVSNYREGEIVQTLTTPHSSIEPRQMGMLTTLRRSVSIRSF